MLSELNGYQRDLAIFMSDISEKAFCAHWMENLEHVLWRVVLEGPIHYGRADITNEEAEKLRHLVLRAQVGFAMMMKRKKFIFP